MIWDAFLQSALIVLFWSLENAQFGNYPCSNSMSQNLFKTEHLKKSDLRNLITFLPFLLVFNFELLYLTSKFILDLIQKPNFRSHKS